MSCDPIDRIMLLLYEILCPCFEPWRRSCRHGIVANSGTAREASAVYAEKRWFVYAPAQQAMQTSIKSTNEA